MTDAAPDQQAPTALRRCDRDSGRRMLRVCVAGPHAHGDVGADMAAAMEAADALIREDGR